MVTFVRWRSAGASVPRPGLGAGVAVRRGRGWSEPARLRSPDADPRVPRPARARRAPAAARHRPPRLQPQRRGLYHITHNNHPVFPNINITRFTTPRQKVTQI